METGAAIYPLNRLTGYGGGMEYGWTPRTSTPPEPTGRRNRPPWPRFAEIDALRGIAIVMMVLYHLVWDLDRLGDADLASTSGFWSLFATVTTTLFVILVGVSLSVSHDRARRSTTGRASLLRKYFLRGLRILGYGLLITLAIELAGMDGHIWFGILHVIGLSIILAMPFLGRPWRALPVAVAVLLATPVVRDWEINGPWLLWLGIRGDAGRMLDYRPLLPWFGVVLLGIVAGSLLYRDGRRRFPLPQGTPTLPTQLLATLGRNSLLIYLLHQPLLIGTLCLMGLVEL